MTGGRVVVLTHKGSVSAKHLTVKIMVFILLSLGNDAIIEDNSFRAGLVDPSG
jgi:hypothetical protein